MREAILASKDVVIPQDGLGTAPPSFAMRKITRKGQAHCHSESGFEITAAQGIPIRPAYPSAISPSPVR